MYPTGDTDPFSRKLLLEFTLAADIGLPGGKQPHILNKATSLRYQVANDLSLVRLKPRPPEDGAGVPVQPPAPSPPDVGAGAGLKGRVELKGTASAGPGVCNSSSGLAVVHARRARRSVGTVSLRGQAWRVGTEARAGHEEPSGAEPPGGTSQGPAGPSRTSFTRGTPIPPSLNGVDFVPRQIGRLGGPGGLPPIDLTPQAADGPKDGRTETVGAVMVEPDGRVWLVARLDGSGGKTYGFPEHVLPPGMSRLRALGLSVTQLTGLVAKPRVYLKSYDNDTTFAHMFVCERTGGSPADMADELAELALVTIAEATILLENPRDRRILADLQESRAPRQGRPVAGHWLGSMPYQPQRADPQAVRTYVTRTAFNIQHRDFPQLVRRAQVFERWFPAEERMLQRTTDNLRAQGKETPEMRQSTWMVHAMHGALSSLDISEEWKERIASAYRSHRDQGYTGFRVLPDRRALPVLTREARDAVAMMVSGERGPMSVAHLRLAAEITYAGFAIATDVVKAPDWLELKARHLRALRADGSHPTRSKYGIDITADPTARVLEEMELPVMTGLSGIASAVTLAHLHAAGESRWAAPGLDSDEAKAVMARLILLTLRDGRLPTYVRDQISTILGDPRARRVPLSRVQTHTYAEVNVALHLTFLRKTPEDRDALVDIARRTRGEMMRYMPPAGPAGLGGAAAPHPRKPH